MSQITIKEIIEETIEYYATHNFGASDDGNCLYYAEQSCGTEVMCAVGRCMTDAKEFQKDYPSWSRQGASNLHHMLIVEEGVTEGLDSLLKPEYRGHPVPFWAGLQDFHDDYHDNFTDRDPETRRRTLSEQGEENAELLIDAYGK